MLAAYTAAEATGKRAVQLAHAGAPRPSNILTAAALDNAIALLMALGGSTNAVIHLLALAGRVGVPLRLDDFDEISRCTPLLANLRPSGEYLVEQLYHAGGVQAVLRELAPPLQGDAMTVTGETLADGFAAAKNLHSSVIAPLASRWQPRVESRFCEGISRPTKRSSNRRPPRRRCFATAAVQSSSKTSTTSRIDDPTLDVDANSVLVLKNTGPKGAPGMPDGGSYRLRRNSSAGRHGPRPRLGRSHERHRLRHGRS
jgi:dihydroxyacid dehydratase/phosphogluconate dehydratase